MGLKFDEIYESVVSRFQIGGFLPGDIVKFRPDYKSCDCYKAMHSTMKQEVDNLVKSGLNIKVIQVGDRLSGVSAGNQHKTADNVVITVAGDQGGGRHYGSVAVKPEMIDIVDSNNPNPDVPEQFYRDDEKYLNGRAEEYVADIKNITRLTDKGNKKNTPTNLKLAGESTLLSKDNKNLGDIINEMYSPTDYSLIYEKVLLDEGLLRRIATKFAGGFKSNPLQKHGQTHQFAQSAALEVGKDITKSFGGDYKTHAQALYSHILNYISKVAKI
jgi:hypothetical protein